MMPLVIPTPPPAASVAAGAELGNAQSTVNGGNARKPVEFGGLSWRYVIGDDGEVLECVAG